MLHYSLFTRFLRLLFFLTYFSEYGLVLSPSFHSAHLHHRWNAFGCNVCLSIHFSPLTSTFFLELSLFFSTYSISPFFEILSLCCLRLDPSLLDTVILKFTYTLGLPGPTCIRWFSQGREGKSIEIRTGLDVIWLSLHFLPWANSLLHVDSGRYHSPIHSTHETGHPGRLKPLRIPLHGSDIAAEAGNNAIFYQFYKGHEKPMIL